MAKLEGERRARDEGFTAFPVNPFAIADTLDIHVEKKPPGMRGVSGALIFAQPRPIIIYSSEHQSEGFERFSLAHELGHYLLPGHPEEIIAAGGTHFSKAGFSEGSNSIELEADHFAAGLLMPDALVKSHLADAQIGMEGLRSLADLARVSVTAAAISAAGCAPYPLCVIVSEGARVAYAFPSGSFKDLGDRIYLRKNDLLPPSLTADFNRDAANVAGGRRVTGACRLADWFDGARKLPMDEEVLGLGRYGLTLTVLSSEALADGDDDDGAESDETMIDRWTPRFAYRR